MSDLSVFVDESGTQEGMTEYYVVTYVLHDQSDDISWHISSYEGALGRKGLPNIPFHATPLMRAHDAYANLDMGQRKYLLMSFNMLVQKLPIRYRSFVYRSREFGDAQRLQSLIRRDLAALLVDNLSYFQGFDHVRFTTIRPNGRSRGPWRPRSATRWPRRPSCAGSRTTTPSAWRRWRTISVP